MHCIYALYTAYTSIYAMYTVYTRIRNVRYIYTSIIIRNVQLYTVYTYMYAYFVGTAEVNCKHLYWYCDVISVNSGAQVHPLFIMSSILSLACERKLNLP